MTTSMRDSYSSSSIEDDNPEAIKVEPSALFENAKESAVDRLDWYREVLRVDPTSQVSFLAAEELCARGLWGEAIGVCRGGLTFHPYHLRGRVLLGQALWNSGEHEEAETTLLAAREDLEKNIETFQNLIEAAKSSGDIGFAEKLRIPFQVSQPAPVQAALDPESFYRAFEQAALPNLESEDQESPDEVQHQTLHLAEEAEEEAIQVEPTVVEPSEPPFVPFLAALLERYEQHPESTEPVAQGIFSDSERRALKNILTRALH